MAENCTETQKNCVINSHQVRPVKLLTRKANSIESLQYDLVALKEKWACARLCVLCVYI